MRRTGRADLPGGAQDPFLFPFPIPFPFPYPFPFPFFQRVEDLPFWEVFALQGTSTMSVFPPMTVIAARPRGDRGRGIE